MEQSDITGFLQEFDFSIDENEQLMIANPPLVRLPNQEVENEKIMPREEDPYGNA